MSVVKIPALNPYRFHQFGVGDWWQNQIPYMEPQYARYCQKLSPGDLFTLQFLVKEYDLKGGVYEPKCELVDQEGTLVHTFAVNNPVTLPYIDGYYVYYVSSNIPSLTDGVYYCKLTVYYPHFEEGGSWGSLVFYSEPIWVKTHEHTVLIRYEHSTNDFDCVFTDAAVKAFALRIEGGIRSDGFTPGGKYEIFNDLDFEPVMLQSSSYNTYKWSFGPGSGLPNYMADKLNRIFALDTVTIDGESWMRSEGGKLEGERDKTWPMGGWSIELVKTENEHSEGFDLEAFTVDSTVVTCDSDLITCDKTLI